MNDIALSSNLIDRTSSTIYVSNIRHSTPINSIFNIFSKFGPLERCEIPENKFGKTRGFAFIEFENKMNAYSAFEELSKQEILLDGRVLKLEWARATKLYKEDIQNLSSESKEKIMGAFSRNHNFDSRYSKKGNTRKISSKVVNNGTPNNINNNNNNTNNNNGLQSNNINTNTNIINNNIKPISSPSFSSSPSIGNNNNTIINNSPTSISNSNSYLNGIVNNSNFELNNSNNITNLNGSSNGIQLPQQSQQPQSPQQLTPKKKTFIKKDQNETSPILNNSTLYNNGFMQQQTSPHHHLSQSQPHLPTSPQQSMNGGSPSQTSSNMKKLNNSTVNLNVNSYHHHNHQSPNGIGNHQFVSTNNHHHHHHQQQQQQQQQQTNNPLLPIPGLSKSLNGIGSTSYLDSNSIPIIDHNQHNQISNYGAYFGIPNFNQSFDFNLSFNQTLNNLSNLDLHSRIILPNDQSNTVNHDGSPSISGGSSLIGNVSNSPSKMTTKTTINTSPLSSSTLSLHQSHNNNNNKNIISANLVSNSNGAIPTNGGSPNSSSPATSDLNTMGKIAPSISNQPIQNGFFNNNDEYLTELNASLHSIHNGNISNFSSSSSYPNHHYFASSQDPIFISSPPGINTTFSHFSPISSFNNNPFFK
ncbi:hypothetical protein DICPUDRAFT_100079 [Dictyostelium purpureum]|uniref:RRM domain-containing protein n=1 Tax=Dictyostelium purpureum TaxID=5786 RepID=F1A592_DICPU|nr:uncharacterized protein DICPUDRAFT_100079 [Dictyostelium purpureum]EGC28637.1 hypothetical protein DICPUDRAFT_100079 [Dictyostelium purpureum]|eukprot:XP_003294836.1 hypothetical protein DICPUDRAFT_100079 [Dictyostelium purpureum]